MNILKKDHDNLPIRISWLSSLIVYRFVKIGIRIIAPTHGNLNHSAKTGLNSFYTSQKRTWTVCYQRSEIFFKNPFDFGYGICYVNLNFFQQKIIKTEKTFCLIGDNLIEPVHNWRHYLEGPTIYKLDVKYIGILIRKWWLHKAPLECFSCVLGQRSIKKLYLFRALTV